MLDRIAVATMSFRGRPRWLLAAAVLFAGCGSGSETTPKQPAKTAPSQRAVTLAGRPVPARLLGVYRGNVSDVGVAYTLYAPGSPRCEAVRVATTVSCWTRLQTAPSYKGPIDDRSPDEAGPAAMRRGRLVLVQTYQRPGNVPCGGLISTYVPNGSGARVQLTHNQLSHRGPKCDALAEPVRRDPPG